MSFFTQKMCREYYNKINKDVVEKSEQVIFRCKSDFKNGVCFQYTGTMKKYHLYKSCRSKKIKQKDIFNVKEVCDTNEFYLFDYLQETLHPWKDKTKTDIFSDETTHETPKDIDYVIVYKNNQFCGLMIVELNECDKKKPNGLYSVKLICAQKCGEKSISMQLFGIYLYVLKKKFPSQKVGLLELAGGYRNTVGYCLYSKFNFKITPAFDCKEYEKPVNLNNLIMTVDMSTIEADTLLQKIITNTWYNEDMKQSICNRCTDNDNDCEWEKTKQLMIKQNFYEEKIPQNKKKVIIDDTEFEPWNKNYNLFSSWINSKKKDNPIFFKPQPLTLSASLPQPRRRSSRFMKVTKKNGKGKRKSRFSRLINKP